MDAVFKALVYVILSLVAITANIWLIRSIKNAYFGESPPYVIAPFQVIGKDDSGGKLGSALASMLLARLARIRQEMEASVLALQAARDLQGEQRIQTVEHSQKPSLSVPEKLFAPVNVNVTVGGVEVGGIISWINRALVQDNILQVSLQFDEGKIIAVTHGRSAGDALWIETTASQEQAVTDIAYALTQQQFSRRISEVEALNTLEFQLLLSTLQKVAELDRQVALGRSPGEAYKQLLANLEGLLEKAPRWKALIRLVAEIAERAGDGPKAVVLYKKEMDLTDVKAASYAELLRRIDKLSEKVAALPTTPVQPPKAGVPLESVDPKIRWLLNMLGVTTLSMSGEPVIAVVGGVPPPGTVAAERMEVLGAGKEATRPPSVGDTMTQYTRTIVQAVQFVAPNAHFAFAPLNSQTGSTTDSELISALDRAIKTKPDILLVTLGPLEGPAFEAVFKQAIAQGTLLVVAAGNESGKPVSFSASPVSKSILVASAVGADGQPTSFTQSGKNVFWAPGEKVPVELAPGEREAAGTSYSAALAAGVAARVLAEHPKLGLPVLLDTLRTTAKPVRPTGPPILNLAAALERLRR